MPQGPPSAVEQGAVVVVAVAVVNVAVLCDDVLQVWILPVQVASLNGPCEHSPVGPRQGICKQKQECAA